ncbi:MAG: hypothetical protein ABJ370_20985 [Paracoccaceae bacterium]
MVVKKSGMVFLRSFNQKSNQEPSIFALEATERNFTCRPLDACDNVEASEGFFQLFDEGIFVVFCDSRDHVYVGWRNSLHCLENSAKVLWKSNFMYKTFYLVSKNSEGHRFSYESKFRAPWNIILDIVAPSDDWGMDLPEWVEYAFHSEDIVIELRKIGAQES